MVASIFASQQPAFRGLPPVVATGGGVFAYAAGASNVAYWYIGQAVNPRVGFNYGYGIPWLTGVTGKKLFRHNVSYSAVADPFYTSNTNFGSTGGAGWTASGTGGSATSVSNQAAAIVAAANTRGVPNAQRICFLDPGRNDMEAGTYTGAQELAFYEAFIDTLIAGGFVRIFVMGPWFKSTTVGGNWAAAGSARVTCQYLIDNLPTMINLKGGKAVFVRTDHRMNSQTGNKEPIAGITVDNTHTNPVGGRLLGLAMQDAGVDLHFSASTYAQVAAGATNILVAQSGSAGTVGGGVSGTVFSNYGVNRDQANCTVVASRPSGNDIQRAVSTITVAPATAMGQVRYHSISTITPATSTLVYGFHRVVIPVSTCQYNWESFFSTNTTRRGGSPALLRTGTPYTYLDASAQGDGWVWDNTVAHDLWVEYLEETTAAAAPILPWTCRQYYRGTGTMQFDAYQPYMITV